MAKSISSSTELADLLQQKESLNKKIALIKDRLSFVNSEPLNDHFFQLLKQEMDIICKITDLLCKK